MSKNDNQNHNDAAEYLARAEWENKQIQRRTPLPWNMIPKWRYKKVASASDVNEKKIWRFMGISIAMACLGIGYFLGSKIVLPVLIIIFLFGLFFWLAIRDASKETKDDN